MDFPKEMQRPTGRRTRMSGTAERASRFARAELWQLAVLAAAVTAAAAATGWLLVRSDGDTASDAGSGPALVSQARLEALASTGSPVYWAGPREGFAYELTTTPSGRVFVRYLPRGVAAGNPRASFLTVATYPAAGSFEKLKQAAQQPGTHSARLDKDGLAVFAPARSSSVYISYPGADYQVEVYAPSLDSARRLVESGSIKPIG